MSLVMSLPVIPPRSPHHLPISRSSTPTNSRPLSRPHTPPPLPPAISPNEPYEALSAPPTPVTMKSSYLSEMSEGITMERAHSSQPAFNPPYPYYMSNKPDLVNYPEKPPSRSVSADKGDRADRGGRGRDVKATTLLFKTVPSSEDIKSVETSPLSRTQSKTSPQKKADISEDEYMAEDKEVHDHQSQNKGPVPELSPAISRPLLSGPTSSEYEVEQSEDLKMDVDEDITAEIPLTDEQHRIWGMPKWGMEDDRKEVRPGVRLVSMTELPELLEQHALLDTPSHVLFPWLHGISDDGRKGIDMASFFGLQPPFEPPSYRGLVLVRSPRIPEKAKQPAPAAEEQPERPPLPHRTNSQDTALPHDAQLVTSPEPQNPPIDPMSSASSQPTSPTESHGRSDTMSTASDSYRSFASTTEGTSPSIADWNPKSVLAGPSSLPTISSIGIDMAKRVEEPQSTERQVEMHPTDSKRVSLPLSTSAPNEHRPMEGANDVNIQVDEVELGDEKEKAPSDDPYETTAEHALLLNSLEALEIFDFPVEELEGGIKYGGPGKRRRFIKPRLPQQINLRNLNIQQIKYSSISDIILYAKHGAEDQVLEMAEMIRDAQEHTYRKRMEKYYRHVTAGDGEGLNRPIKYGVWVVIEPFSEIEKHCPHLIEIDSKGNYNNNTAHCNTFERESIETRIMTGATEVVEGFYVGNPQDLGSEEDGSAAAQGFDLEIRAYEFGEMPTSRQMDTARQAILRREEAAREKEFPANSSTSHSAASKALRSVLSASKSAVSSEPQAGGSGIKRTASPLSQDSDRSRRSRTTPPSTAPSPPPALHVIGGSRSMWGTAKKSNSKVNEVVEFVYFVRDLIQQSPVRENGKKRKVLIHCIDGYTESSIITLAYIMCAMEISLPEAFIHLHRKRSFFLYSTDKGLLHKVDERLTQDRKAQALALIQSSPSPGGTTGGPNSPVKWKSWNNPFTKSSSTTSLSSTTEAEEKKKAIENARLFLAKCDSEETKKATQEQRVWFDDKKFDAFPSRILPFLYLGNLDHAANAAMLEAVGITHVVSVGESLLTVDPDHPHYGEHTKNTLSAAAKAGKISVLDLTDVRDDGNDPLRPVIARACTWMEAARVEGGVVLVHCRVGVSRSASIVMAYLMQYHGMGLMDAYLLTRARRLNVLIQPNLRFFHELFGWEVELARREAIEGRPMSPLKTSAGEYTNTLGMVSVANGHRRIMYTWPSFCRDLYQLNRRFLCN